MKSSLVASVTILMLVGEGLALGQPRASVTSYLQQGYQVISSTIGGMYLVLILKKDASLVLCSVVIESGQTNGCQAIK